MSVNGLKNWLSTVIHLAQVSEKFRCIRATCLQGADWSTCVIHVQVSAIEVRLIRHWQSQLKSTLNNHELVSLLSGQFCIGENLKQCLEGTTHLSASLADVTGSGSD